MFREAHANWTGGPYAGEGKVSTPSGVLASATYAFGKLAEIPPCTTPCELLAAAIASCMSVMVALEMLKLDMRPVKVDSYVALKLDNPANKWQVTHAHVEIKAVTRDGERKRFEQAVETACQECPVSSALKLNLTRKADLVLLTASATA
jgi:lipoyl-dependent peroxiredoxin